MRNLYLNYLLCFGVLIGALVAWIVGDYFFDTKNREQPAVNYCVDVPVESLYKETREA